MKLALISDIHGNSHALEAVLADIERRGAERIIVLGDVVFKGPRPELCVRRVRELGAPVLRGNIDELVGLNVIQPGFAKSPEQEAALHREMEWTRARLAEEELTWLGSLPLMHTEQLHGGLTLRCVHATPQNVLDIVLPNEAEEGYARMFEGGEADLVAYGHIHLPFVRFFGGRALVGTGSVGLPFDGDPRASYALLEAEDGAFTVSIRRVPYDIEAAIAAFSGTGHPCAESVAAALRAGRRPL